MAKARLRFGAAPGASSKDRDMNANIGTLDRTLRIIAGAALIAATLAGFIGLWGWIGVVPLATGALRFCPLYRLLGFSTCACGGATTEKRL